MNTAIINNPYNDKTVSAHFKSGSFIEMVNFWNNQKSTDSPIITLSDLPVDLNKVNPETETWVPIIWELDGNKDLATKQAEVIKDFIANPNYIWWKNQGKDKPKTKNVVIGKRELHSSLHLDTANNHLHTLQHVYSVAPNGTINNQDNIARRSEAKTGFIEEINKRLLDANLPAIDDLTLNNKSLKENKVSETTKAQSIVAIEEKKTLEEHREDTAHLKQVNPVAINDEYNRLKAEFDLNEKKQAERLQALQQLQEANDVALKYNALVETTQAQQTAIEDLTSNIDELKIVITNKDNIISDVTLKAEQQIIDVTLKLNTTHQNVIENLKEVFTKQLDDKDTNIIDIQDKLNLETDKLNKETIKLNAEKEKNKQLEEDKKKLEEEKKLLDDNFKANQELLDGYKKLLEEIKENNAKQDKQIKELEKLNGDLVKENQKHIAEIAPLANKIATLVQQNTVLTNQVTNLQFNNSNLESSNNHLQNTVNSLINGVKRIEQGYNNMVKVIKEKIKGIPELKKDLAPALKEHTEITKEVKAEMTPAQKRIAEMMKKKEEESKSSFIIPEAPKGLEGPSNPFAKKPK